MIIGIDANEANIPRRVGSGQYSFNLLTALSQIDHINIYHLYLKSPPLSDLPTASPHWQYHVFGPSKLWTKIALPFHLYTNRLHLDYFLSTSHYSPHFSPFPTIPIIYDLGYLNSRQEFTKKDFHQLSEWSKRSILHARHIITISQFCKNEISRIYHVNSSLVSIIYPGVNLPSLISCQSPTLIKFKISPPFFLALGTLKPNKNYAFLIKSFSQFVQDNPQSPHQLVIAGKKGWLFDDIFQSVVASGLQSKIIFTDFISETEKWALLSQAYALVIPSTYEGFGIPPIESQAVGTPVLSSNIPVLKEVLGDTAIYFDPHDQSSLVKAFNQSLDIKLISTLSKSGLTNCARFTWKNAAKQLINIFNHL